MEIITTGKTINLHIYSIIGYDFDKAMISFKFETMIEEMYFESRQYAMEFYDEILSGLLNEREKIDLSDYKIYHNRVSASSLKEFFQKQKETFECYENL